MAWSNLGCVFNAQVFINFAYFMSILFFYRKAAIELEIHRFLWFLFLAEMHQSANYLGGKLFKQVFMCAVNNFYKSKNFCILLFVHRVVTYVILRFFLTLDAHVQILLTGKIENIYETLILEFLKNVTDFLN